MPIFDPSCSILRQVRVKNTCLAGWVIQTYVISQYPQAKWYVFIWFKYLIPLTCLKFHFQWISLNILCDNHLKFFMLSDFKFPPGLTCGGLGVLKSWNLFSSVKLIKVWHFTFLLYAALSLRIFMLAKNTKFLKFSNFPMEISDLEKISSAIWIFKVAERVFIRVFSSLKSSFRTQNSHFRIHFFAKRIITSRLDDVKRMGGVFRIIPACSIEHKNERYTWIRLCLAFKYLPLDYLNLLYNV